MKNLLLWFVLSLILSSCSTSYGPVGTSGGYTNYKISPNMHKVTFSGNGFTKVPDCERKALYRCAELALLDGCSHFEILKGGTHVDTDVIHIPGQTSVNTNSYSYTSGGAQTTGYLSGNSYYGNTYGSASTYGNSYTTITSTPPMPIPVQKPVTTYIIHTTNRSGSSTYEAIALATEAREKKLKLDRRVASMLPTPESKKVVKAESITPMSN